MRKAELVDRIAKSTGITRVEIATVIDAFISEVRGSVLEGHTIEIRGLGTFSSRTRSGRTGKNPRTGENVTVPAKRVPTFRVSLDWKKSLQAITEDMAQG